MTKAGYEDDSSTKDDGSSLAMGNSTGGMEVSVVGNKGAWIVLIGSLCRWQSLHGQKLGIGHGALRSKGGGDRAWVVWENRIVGQGGLMVAGGSGERGPIGELFGKGAVVGLSKWEEGGSWSDFLVRLRWGGFWVILDAWWRFYKGLKKFSSSITIDGSRKKKCKREEIGKEDRRKRKKLRRIEEERIERNLKNFY